MNKRDSLGDRMKGYENCYRLYLPKNQAVMLRLDSRAFHSLTKGFQRPYDKLFAQCVWQTAKRLCDNISGAKFCYTQSDEISIVLTDYESIKTEPWFDNNLQKIVSISASMASIFFHEAMGDCIHDICYSWSHLDWNNKEEMDANRKRLNEFYGTPLDPEAFDEYNSTVQHAYCNKLAVFDARAFILPREEVVNYFYWRQLDCVRNSIQLAGQANFSHNNLQGKNCNEIQEMLFQEKDINWANYPNWFKNGVALFKMSTNIQTPSGEVVVRNKWHVDFETPMFSQNKDYINIHI